MAKTLSNRQTVGTNLWLWLDNRLTPWLYLALFFLAEILTHMGMPIVGFLAQGAILLTLIAHAVFGPIEQVRRMCLAIAVVVVVKIVSAGLTQGMVDLFAAELIVDISWLSAALIAKHYLALRPVQLSSHAHGERGWLEKYLAPILAGPTLGLTGYALLQPRLLVDPLAYPLWAMAAMAALVLFVAFVEVMVYYGILLQQCVGVLGSWVSVAYVAVLFGLGRLGSLDWQYGLLASLEGLFLGWLVLRTRTIYPAILTHGLVLLFFSIAAVWAR